MQGCLKGILALSQILLQSVFSIGQGGVSHPSVSKSDTLNSESQSLVEIVSLVPEGPGVSGEKSQEEKKGIKFLESVGFSLSLNPEKTLLKVLAMEPLGKKKKEREIIIKIKTELPVELEGRTPDSLILIT